VQRIQRIKTAVQGHGDHRNLEVEGQAVGKEKKITIQEKALHTHKKEATTHRSDI
jgi:hypothetical protein